MIRVLALFQNGQSPSNLLRLSFHFPSREEVSHSTQEFARSRSNCKGCLHCEDYFGIERYAAASTRAHLQARSPLFTEALGRLASNYTLCGDDTTAPPFMYIIDWYDYWQPLLNEVHLTVT